MHKLKDQLMKWLFILYSNFMTNNAILKMCIGELYIVNGSYSKALLSCCPLNKLTGRLAHKGPEKCCLLISPLLLVVTKSLLTLLPCKHFQAAVDLELFHCLNGINAWCLFVFIVCINNRNGPKIIISRNLLRTTQNEIRDFSYRTLE